jgi:aryl-alcohol dehydrogenase-like predicted oxidoreductase
MKRLGIILDLLQAQYSLLCRETEWELTEVCEREGIALLPWSPLKVCFSCRATKLCQS